jgi:hypothetical protein
MVRLRIYASLFVFMMWYWFEQRDNFTFITHYRNGRSWGSMVGIVAGYRLDDGGVRV